MSKIKDDLKEGEVTNPDGSVFRFEGEEPLKKPKDKKSLKDRWKVLKADLSNSSAFLSMLGEDDEKKEDTDQGGSSPNTGNPVGSSVPVDDTQGGGEGGEPGMADSSQVPNQDGGVDPQADTASQQDQAQPQDQQEEQPYSEEELVQLLKEEGYSDSEIAYIVHHQVPAQPTKEELKHAETVQDLKHKGAKQDQELDHKDAHHDIDVDHKKRMTDLEFEHAKKEKELRLKFLEQELEAKVAAIKSKAKEDK
jgi:hypothetical protein